MNQKRASYNCSGSGVKEGLKRFLLLENCTVTNTLETQFHLSAPTARFQCIQK